MPIRLLVSLLLVLVAGCTTTPDASPPSGEADGRADEDAANGVDDDTPLVDAPDGVIVYAGADEDGTATGDLVVALPDGTELYRAEGRDTPVYPVPTGFPDRAWLLAESPEGGLEVGLLDVTALGVRGLDLPAADWQVPRPGSARVVDRYAALVAPGQAVALVDLGAGTATVLDIVPEPSVASLSPDGTTLLIGGAQAGALVETADPTRVLPLDVTPIEWLDGGTRLLVEADPGPGVLTLADGSITSVGVARPRSAVPTSEDTIIAEVDGQLVLTDLDGANPQPLADAVGGTLVVDPGGEAVVTDTPDGLMWVPLDGGQATPIGPSTLQVVAWPGPSGPRVAWFGLSGERGAPLVGVDLATGAVSAVAPDVQGDEWATFDLSGLALTDDWRTGLVPLRNGLHTDLLYVGLDRPASLVVSGNGVTGDLSPDGTLLVTSRATDDAAVVVGIGGPGGAIVVEVGAGTDPVWLPVE
ncbi:hypothetical protein [Euzebya rosea]|uniref:hypothetical protein n=1 Tax=Euzebya rosea TaxID=2052804 RepID=UPI000D3EA74A|nr:hypothetical protein [Euzebya rosea]